MILYHLRRFIYNDNRHFYPRVPVCTRIDEDSSTKRVCTCTTVGGCITAMPIDTHEPTDYLYYDIYERRRNTQLYNKYTCDEIEDFPHFILFKINTEKIGIDNKNIIDSKTLYDKDLVRDAYWTDEHWITTKFEVPREDMKYIWIENWHQSIQDLVPADVFYDAMEGDGDVYSLYRKRIGKKEMPSIVIIDDVEYRIENDFRLDKINEDYLVEMKQRGWV